MNVGYELITMRESYPSTRRVNISPSEQENRVRQAADIALQNCYLDCEEIVSLINPPCSSISEVFLIRRAFALRTAAIFTGICDQVDLSKKLVLQNYEQIKQSIINADWTHSFNIPQRSPDVWEQVLAVYKNKIKLKFSKKHDLLFQDTIKSVESYRNLWEICFFKPICAEHGVKRIFSICPPFTREKTVQIATYSFKELCQMSLEQFERLKPALSWCGIETDKQS